MKYLFVKRSFQLAACALALTGASALLAQEAVVLCGHTGEMIPISTIRKADKTNARTVTSRGASDITWSLTYLDAPGVGFNDVADGANRRATLEAVLDYVGNQFSVSGPRIVNVQVDASLFDGTGALASAGASYVLADGYQKGGVFEKIVHNVDPLPADPEMTIQVDFAYDWHTTLDPIPASPTQWDLFTVLLHEVTHGLGVASFTTASGDSRAAPTELFTGWDDLLYETSTNTKIWSSALSPIYQLDAGDLNQGDNTLDFRGASSASAFGSNPPLYSPASFLQGSSISHWQQVAPIPAAVMRPLIPDNTEIRTYQPFELAALEDLGYTLASSVQDWSLF